MQSVLWPEAVSRHDAGAFKGSLAASFILFPLIFSHASPLLYVFFLKEKDPLPYLFFKSSFWELITLLFCSALGKEA